MKKLGDNLFLLLIIYVTLLGRRALSQKLPTRHEDHFHFQTQNPEIFHDTKTLPDGAEFTAYIEKEAKRYFFVVEEDNTPVSIIVTPCSSALDWKLYLQDLPEEGSGGKSEEDQLMQQQEPVKEENSIGTLVKSYSGNNVMTYFSKDSPAGIYMLEILITDTESTVKIYATTTPESDQPYPQLPTDPQLDVIGVTKNRISLAWKSSPSDILHPHPIQYCVARNTRKNYKTLCALNAALYGDEPPTVPPNAGFGFSWERVESVSYGFKKKPQKRNKDRNNDIVIECIGKNTWHSFIQLHPDTQYYFDVFAFNNLTNRSTGYVGINQRTKLAHRPKAIYVKIDKVSNVSLKPTQNSPHLFAVRVRRSAKELLLSLEPCIGRVKVDIMRDGKMLKSANIKGLTIYTFENVTRGIYYLKVLGNRRQSQTLKVFATIKPSKFPYPLLPEDTRIKVFENLRTCNSVTLAWLGTDENLQYCLYKRIEKNNLRRLYTRHNQCVAPDLRKKTDKIMCKDFKRSGKRTDVLTEVVKGLKTATTYVFDVYVTKYGGESLNYQSAWVTTRDRC